MATIVDLTTSGSFGEVNGSFWSTAEYVAGTGLIDSFVRIHATGTEQGYNSSADTTIPAGAPNPQFDEDNQYDSNFNHALELSAIPIVSIWNVETQSFDSYYEFRLDVNEISQHGEQYISLDALQIYQSDSDQLYGFTGSATSTGTFNYGGDSFLKWNLDDGDVNNRVELNYDLQPGSGAGDVSVFVPVGTFDQDLQYVYLYSAFGYVGDDAATSHLWSSSDGFEEWSIGFSPIAASDLTGYKFNDLNGDGVRDEGEPGLENWTIYLDQNQNEQLDFHDDVVANGLWDPGEGERWTTTDADGKYTFTDLAAGLGPDSTFYVREVQQSGWVQTAPLVDSYDIPDLDGESATVVDPVNDPDPEVFDPTIIVEIQTARATYSLPDFGNHFVPLPPAGAINGFKWHDVNANGIWDGTTIDDAEPPLSGWTIFIDAKVDGVFNGELDWHDDVVANGVWDPGEGEVWTTTDALGGYTLSLTDALELGGEYHLLEVVQDGWHQSYDGGFFFSVDADTGDVIAPAGTLDADGNGEAASFEEQPMNFGNYQDATKSGTKYEDLNANGAFDEGEQGLEGWTIVAYTAGDDGTFGTDDDVDSGSDTTDSSGNYLIEGLKPGEYQFREVMTQEQIDAGWVASSGPITETLTSGQASTDNDFFNYQEATKSGTKYEDLNANGVFDDGEQGLEGWTIVAYMAGDDGTFGTDDDVDSGSDTTDSNGDYLIEGLKPGEYQFREVMTQEQIDAGWIASSGPITETLTSGQDSVDNDFFNYQEATKSGTKYEDLNANGVFDEGEPGLEGWTIVAYMAGDDGTFGTDDDVDSGSDTTDSNGDYLIEGLKPGEYQFREVMTQEQIDAGWIASSGPITETLTSGQDSVDNDFFNYQLASLSGMKFQDLNANGVHDDGETGLEGWTITLYDADGAVVDTTTTGPDGSYEFTGLTPGDYSVKETQQDGWIQTGPDLLSEDDGDDTLDGDWDITLQSGDHLTDLNFANMQENCMGPLTPGFWSQHLWAWDGNLSTNGKVVNGVSLYDKLQDSGVLSENLDDILIPVDTNNDGSFTSADAKGVLLGDVNNNGLWDDEADLFVYLKDAQYAINASQNLQSQDVRLKMLRDVIAAQLNDNNGADAGADLITADVKWLTATSPFDSFSSGPTGDVDQNNDGIADFKYQGSVFKGLLGTAVKSSDPAWQQAKEIDTGLFVSAGQLHELTDDFNNGLIGCVDVDQTDQEFVFTVGLIGSITLYDGLGSLFQVGASV